MIDWKKYGFNPDSEYEYVFIREDFPLDIWVINGYFSLSVNMGYTISKGIIPATEESLQLLLKAFHLKY